MEIIKIESNRYCKQSYIRLEHYLQLDVCMLYTRNTLKGSVLRIFTFNKYKYMCV